MDDQITGCIIIDGFVNEAEVGIIQRLHRLGLFEKMARGEVAVVPREPSMEARTKGSDVFWTKRQQMNEVWKTMVKIGEKDLGL